MTRMPAISKRIPSSALHRRFCERVKARRVELGMTQEEAAERLGVSGPQWNYIENGKSPPGLDTIERVAKCLKCDAEDLIARELQRAV
jgi:transcriptional regulator with XRE-family HTH domain